MSKPCGPYDVFSHWLVPFEVAAYSREHKLSTYAQSLRKALVRQEALLASRDKAQKELDELDRTLEDQRVQIRNEVAAVLTVMKVKGQTK